MAAQPHTAPRPSASASAMLFPTATATPPTAQVRMWMWRGRLGRLGRLACPARQYFGGMGRFDERRTKTMMPPGTSSLYSGERRQKTDVTFAALGDVDELNSCLGIAVTFSSEGLDTTTLVDAGKQLRQRLMLIQCELLDLGSSIATPLTSSSDAKLARTGFDPARVDRLEEWIDDTEAGLSPLKNFILPGGTICSSHLHLARAVCRRAERTVVHLVMDEAVDAVVGRYLNRLGDYLFVAARVANQIGGTGDVVYQKAG